MITAYLFVFTVSRQKIGMLLCRNLSMVFSIPPKAFLSFGQKHCIAALLRSSEHVATVMEKGLNPQRGLETLKTYVDILEKHEIPFISTMALKLKKRFPTCIVSLQLWIAFLEKENKRQNVDNSFFVTTIDRREKKGCPMKNIDLVLDNLRSSFNVGCLFRTAEALGVRKVYLCGYTATPQNPKLTKSSLGSEQWITWEHFDSTLDCLSKLGRDKVTLYALETAVNAKDINMFKPIFPCALILGNERFGLGTPVLKAAHHILSIPLYGRKNSLNVAVCGSMALGALSRSYL